MVYEDIIKKLRPRLTAKRFKHSVGVSETAVKLAKRYGGDADKAKLAGILHDCAREIPRNNLLQTAEAFGIVLNDIERREPVLTHAKIGALMARREYGIDDIEIVRAIELHTTGGPEMTLLDKIVYLADMIEPGRKFPGLENLRSIAEKDLDKAVLAAFNQTIIYQLEGHGLLHPATVEGRNALLIQMRI